MDIIRIDSPVTFPLSIKSAVMEKQSVLSQYMQQVNEKSDKEIRYALEYNYMYTDKELNVLLIHIQKILENCLFEGFHNTRVLRKTDLVETGLQLLTKTSYFQLVRSILAELNISVSEQENVCSVLEEYLDNKHGKRTDMLSFFSPITQSGKYLKFTKNIGGEVCEFGLSKSFPDIYDRLTSNGYPVTVRFAYPFRNVEKFMKDVIAFEFIRHCAARLIIDYDYAITVEASLIHPVEPHNILDILEFIDHG